MAVQDRRWKAESDFRSLTEAEQVRTDRGRLRRARSAGRRMIRDEQRALRVKRTVAGVRR